VADLPPFYNPDRIGTLFYPDAARIASEAVAANLPPSTSDERKTKLLIVDMQVDFCHEQGALYVPGAVQDVRRVIEFIYRNSGQITDITCSLDSHLPFQIFHPAWWVDGTGAHPAPFTIITHEAVRNGEWRPVRAPDWSVAYVRQLQEKAKKELVIWPYHVPIGGIGSALDPELWSAVFWHAIARRSQPLWWTKGSIPETEHYSIIRPEIPVPDRPQGDKSQELLGLLAQYDHVFIAGEAASHCVLETLEDLVQEFGDRPEAMSRFHLLRDCTSPVPHPEVDFAAIAEAQFAEYEQRGLQFVNSTDPLPE
jgi:nicotinamidase-related amidase